MLSEVIISKLEKLQEILDRCKSMTKLTESQLNFFKMSNEHQSRILELFSSSSRDVSLANSDANGSIQVSLENSKKYQKLAKHNYPPMVGLLSPEKRSLAESFVSQNTPLSCFNSR